jgi:hypothetical protein
MLNEISQDTSQPVEQNNCRSIIVIMIVIVGILMLIYYFRIAMSKCSSLIMLQICDRLFCFISVLVYNLLLVVLNTFAMHCCIKTLLERMMKSNNTNTDRVCPSFNDICLRVCKFNITRWKWCSTRLSWFSMAIFACSFGWATTWFCIRTSA